MNSSAERLEGMKLDGGWTVSSIIPKSASSTGGNFSVCYYVESHDGRKAFLKALDISRSFQTADPLKTLEAMTAAFNFERDVLEKCKNEHLDRVVTAISDGVVKFDDSLDGLPVHYLIFELADGDVRNESLLSSRFEIAWILRSLHHIATGLQQIHSHGIAHQDLKPSNVLVFKKNTSKIADFGKAAYKGHFPPHEDDIVPGDPTYAPPELLYGLSIPEWTQRRFSCDAYHLGSMAVFFFCDLGMTPMIFREIPTEYNYRNWGGTYYQVLPYIRDGFHRVLERFAKRIPLSLRTDLPEIVSQLCEPDPSLRGDPRNRNSRTQFSMERYISKFNLLARKAELGLLIEK